MVPVPVPVPVGIIGGGLSGLSAAKVLSSYNIPSILFEKSKHGTGRILTRRFADCSADLGAQYFTARDLHFQHQVQEWQRVGVVQKWRGVIGSWNTDGFTESKSQERFVGVPGMNAICKHMVEDLKEHACSTVLRDSLVTQVSYLDTTKEWEIEVEGSMEKYRCSNVIITVPAGQAEALLKEEELLDAVKRVSMERCWAVSVKLKSIEIELDGVFINNSDILSWAAKESSKPGRNAQSECWTLHSKPEWAAKHFEDDKDGVVKMMVEEFGKLSGKMGLWEMVEDSVAQRWKYAKAVEPIKAEGGFLSGKHGLYVVGDWVNGSRVEGAYCSGFYCAQHIAAQAKL